MIFLSIEWHNRNLNQHRSTPKRNVLNKLKVTVKTQKHFSQREVFFKFTECFSDSDGRDRTGTSAMDTGF